MPRIVDHAKRRDELARAAAHVIAAMGVENATVRAIAREAGCSTGVLAHYFADKHAIVLSGIEWANQRLIARILDTLGELETLEDLAALCRSALPLDRASEIEWRVRLHFWGYAAARPELRHFHRREIERWRRTVTQFVGAAQQDGIIRDDLDAAETATRLVSTLFGTGIQMLFDPPRRRPHMLAALEASIAALAPPASFSVS